MVGWLVGWLAQGLLWAAVSGSAVDLRWEAPAPCPDAQHVAARIAARIPAELVPPAVLDARVLAADPGYVLRLHLVRDGAAWQREVVSDRCDELADATALIVAVALDPVFLAERVVEAEPTAPSIPDPAPPTVADANTSPSTPRPADTPPASPPRPAGIGVALRPTAGVWFGAVPRVAATIGVDVVVDVGRTFRAELGALAIPRQRTNVTADAGAQLWLATAVARACAAPNTRRVRPSACAGLAAGAIGGRGRGAAVRSDRALQPWVSAVASAGLDITIVRRLAAFARVEGHMHLRRPGFHLDQVGSVHRSGEASVTALVGLQAQLR